MNIANIKCTPLRRAVAIAILPVGFVACLGVCLWAAVLMFSDMLTETPEEFARVWRGNKYPPEDKP